MNTFLNKKKNMKWNLKNNIKIIKKSFNTIYS